MQGMRLVLIKLAGALSLLWVSSPALATPERATVKITVSVADRVSVRSGVESLSGIFERARLPGQAICLWTPQPTRALTLTISRPDRGTPFAQPLRLLPAEGLTSADRDESAAMTRNGLHQLCLDNPQSVHESLAADAGRSLSKGQVLMIVAAD
jgi:hypothetical protein